MKYKHYNFKYKGIKIDPYRIMYEYNITHPAHQHALKKLLRAGNSIKDTKQDIQEVIDSLERWLEMIDEDEQVEQEKIAQTLIPVVVLDENEQREKSLQFIKENPMSVQEKSCSTCKHDGGLNLCKADIADECLEYTNTSPTMFKYLHWKPKNIHEIMHDTP